MSPIYEDHRSKRYEPPVIDLENRNSSHTLIVELTGENKNVLEVGTSTGYISRILEERGNTVTGIEIDPEAGEFAGQHCDKMIIGDIEQLDLDAHFALSSFDVIIFEDVLEHLVSPEDVLRKVKKYLRPGGYLAVSLPNVCHGDVILNLLMGDFKYTPMGLLDATHLRFFGLRNIIDLFARCGYSITGLHTTVLPVGGTEQRLDPGIVPEDLVNFVKSLPNASVYQYVFKASPSPDPGAVEAAPAPDLYGLFRGAIEGSIQAEIRPLLEKISVYETRITSLDEEVQQQDRAVLELTSKLSAISVENIRLQEQYDTAVQVSQRLEQELFAIKRSVSHQLMMKFHRVFIEPVFPQGTARRMKYDRGLLVLRNVVSTGPRKLRWYISEWRGHRRLQSSSFVHGTIPIIPHSSDTEKSLETLDKKVAVIIPTKNAGRSFEYTLERIRNQEGIKESDIIIVDSGSKDETLEIAAKFGAHVQQVAPEDFNHGDTRNLGASNADGDYILFTVQDALPIGKYWLYTMVKTLEDNEQLAAVTCRQIPRSDADLFACFSLWHHYTVTLRLHEDCIFSGGDGFDSLPVDEKRRRAGLEDVSCCIRKEIFDQYRFKRIQSSEDLDLGVRLMRGGHKLGYLLSAGVIHSHNRDPEYFFKRSYVDTKTVSEIVGLNSQEICDGCGMNEVIGSIIALYAAMNHLVDRINSLDFDVPPGVLIQKIEVYMRDYFNNGNHCCSSEDIRGPLGGILGDFLHSIPGISPISHVKQVELLFNQFICLLNRFGEYLSIYGSLEDKKGDFISSLYKLFAIVAGASISGYCLKRSLCGDQDDALMSVNAVLCEGV